MRYAIAFGFAGFALLTLAIQQAGESRWFLVTVNVDLSICLLALAALYGLKVSGFGVEALLVGPITSHLLRAILLPYLTLGVTVLFLSRWFDREGLYNGLAERISIGRLPFPFERSQLEEAGIHAVLNLCWEFPRLSGIHRIPGLVTVHLPILDGMAPTEDQFKEAVKTIQQWRLEGRSILIHCAQGHGRTSTIASAVLVRLGLARDVEEALALVKLARPGARPSEEQREALVRHCSANGPG